MGELRVEAQDAKEQHASRLQSQKAKHDARLLHELAASKTEADDLRIELARVQNAAPVSDPSVVAVMQGKLELSLKRADVLKAMLGRHLADTRAAMERGGVGKAVLATMRNMVEDNAGLVDQLLPMQYTVLELRMALAMRGTVGNDERLRAMQVSVAYLRSALCVACFRLTLSLGRTSCGTSSATTWRRAGRCRASSRRRR